MYVHAYCCYIAISLSLPSLPPSLSFPPPPPIVRPIFDWSEGGEYFPKAGPVLDSSLLTQLLTKRVADITPSVEEQSLVADLCTKVSTVVENMILTGEGEHLVSGCMMRFGCSLSFVFIIIRHHFLSDISHTTWVILYSLSDMTSRPHIYLALYG